MPLYDVTTGHSVVPPRKAEQYVALVKLRQELPESTFNRLVRTVDEAIASCKPSANSKLVWTRSAALFGHGSTQPLKHVEHLWANVEKVVGPGKLTLKAVGGLLRWRISLRSDTWLGYRRDSDQLDPSTGKLITISEYWINNDYIPPGHAKPTASQINDLASVWGARVR